jgi:lipooligosaccharide transport system permease protein
LWHGVELCRSLALDTGSVAGDLGHVAYLSAFVLAGGLAANVAYRRSLEY